MPKQLEPKVIREILARHQEGQSVSQTATALHVDYRAVRAAIRRGQQQQQHERATVLVLAQLLRQHYRLMLRMGLALRQVVRAWSPYQGLADSRDPEETLLVLVNLETEAMLWETLQTNSGIGMDREGQTLDLSGPLVSGLLQHERGIRRRLQRWLGIRGRMQAEGSGIWEAVGRISEHRKWDFPRAREPEVMAHILEGRWEETGNRAGEPEDTFFRQLDRRLRESSLSKRAADLQRAAAALGEAVDAMVLRGRPLGACPLCPVEQGSGDLLDPTNLDTLAQDGEAGDGDNPAATTGMPA